MIALSLLFGHCIYVYIFFLPLVDYDLWHEANEVTWALSGSVRGTYASSAEYGLMHRWVSHKHGNKLDNRASELRLVTRTFNAINISRPDTGIRQVQNGKYEVRIQGYSKTVATKEEARQVRKDYIKKLEKEHVIFDGKD